MSQPPGSHHPIHGSYLTRGVDWVLVILRENVHPCTTVRSPPPSLPTHTQGQSSNVNLAGLVRKVLSIQWEGIYKTNTFFFLTHPCRRQPLKIFFISNDRGRSLFEAFDWLFICDDQSDVRDLRVKVVVEIDTP